MHEVRQLHGRLPGVRGGKGGSRGHPVENRGGPGRARRRSDPGRPGGLRDGLQLPGVQVLHDQLPDQGQLRPDHARPAGGPGTPTRPALAEADDFLHSQTPEILRRLHAARRHPAVPRLPQRAGRPGHLAALALCPGRRRARFRHRAQVAQPAEQNPARTGARGGAQRRRNLESGLLHRRLAQLLLPGCRPRPDRGAHRQQHRGPHPQGAELLRRAGPGAR